MNKRDFKQFMKISYNLRTAPAADFINTSKAIKKEIKRVRKELKHRNIDIYNISAKQRKLLDFGFSYKDLDKVLIPLWLFSLFKKKDTLRDPVTEQYFDKKECDSLVYAGSTRWALPQ